jgi:hypothetical protein
MMSLREKTAANALHIAVEIYEQRAADRTVPLDLQVEFRRRAADARLLLDQVERSEVRLIGGTSAKGET